MSATRSLIGCGGSRDGHRRLTDGRGSARGEMHILGNLIDVGVKKKTFSDTERVIKMFSQY